MSNQDVEQGRAVKNEGNSNNNNDPNKNSSIAPFYIETSEKQWTPWLVPMFVVANVAMFVLAMYLNNCPNKNLGSQEKCIPSFLGRFSFQPSKENPLYGPSSSTLEKLGALNWDKVVHRHQGWRLFTCFWLHAGLIHLVVNMLSLVLIGIRLEQQFGFVRVGIIYLLAGMGGSILSSLFIQNYITVGASGALFGLLGAMLSELLTNWSNYTSKGATLFTLIVVIVINAVVGILPRVNNFAHIGGFLTGFLLGFVLLLRPQFKWIERHRLPPEGAAYVSKHKIYQYILLFASLILLISGFTFGLVMLFKGERGNKHCSWCHYLSCVPTSKWDCGN